MDAFYSGSVHFQFDQGSGYWQTLNTASNISGQVVSAKLQEMKRSHPKCRVRAVTDRGQLIDII